MSDGLAKSIEVLGARISSLESSESWLRQEADKAKKERDGYMIEVSGLEIEMSGLEIEVDDLKKQCFEANEKIREYERAVIIDNDGNLVRIKDLPEIEVPGELEEEIQESLSRGKAPDKAFK